MIEIGKLGENVTYTLYSDGAMTVTGSGAIDVSVAQKIHNKDKILSLIIGGEVTSVVYGIFDSCPNLKTVVIGDSVEFLEEKLFEKCKSIESVTMSFAGSSLENAESDTPRPVSHVLFGDSFTGDYIVNNGTYSHVPTCLKEITITGGTKLGAKDFLSFSSLETITIPNDMKTMYEIPELEIIQFTCPDVLTGGYDDAETDRTGV